VPLQDFERIGKTLEDLIALACGGFGYAHDTNFGRFCGNDATAECIGQQLVSEAYPKVRSLHIHDKFSDDLFFTAQPWILALLPYVLRAPHNYHEIERFEIRDVFAFVEFDRVHLQTILPKEVAKDARVLYGNMLQYNYVHVGFSHYRWDRAAAKDSHYRKDRSMREVRYDAIDADNLRGQPRG
jgi:hypothetical protein